MNNQDLVFPAGFIWGTATASHQVEGGNTANNWHAWEQTPGRILHGQVSGRACDWWGGRWREDFDRAAASGQNAHRLSIEWSRIQPAPDRWDDEALAHYRQMLAGLRQRGLTPMVTLHHFTDPLWVSEQGGWENPETAKWFAAYVQRVVNALRDHCTLWCTINEPNVLATAAYLFGDFPPGRKNVFATFKVLEQLLHAHAAAYHILHDLQPSAQVGMAINYRDFLPARPDFLPDRWITRFLSRSFNDFAPAAATDGRLRLPWGTRYNAALVRTQDFIGVNYYSREYVAFDLRQPGEIFHRRFYRPDAELSPTGFIAHEPDGLTAALVWAQTFGLPIHITENGVEDAPDHLRPRYLTTHLYKVWAAIQAGCPVQSYFHWSLIDNFEWERGWTQRFGLWELDIETQERRPRTSADLYAAICRANAIPRSLLARYAPEYLPPVVS